MCELRGFFGLTNYCASYVRQYADIAAPLMDMLKNLPNRPGTKITLSWNDLTDTSFRQLINAIMTLVPWHFTKFSEPFIPSPDASDYAVGAVLQQKYLDGKLRLLAFYARKLTKSHLNWPPREKECYAITVFDPPQVWASIHSSQ